MGRRNKKRFFFAFVRLIGTLYFKKHLSAFVILRNVQTPVQMYNSMIIDETIDARHQQWYNEIHGIINDRICSEEECVLSYTSIGLGHVGLQKCGEIQQQ